ncbi:hypothetical protein EJ02DRAFT_438351 [Clathrospora elynae]|uniref:Uncharacterized protein n=1 Tax=Clathrospora elynae TaxID=706981 RepID=A0A6A5SB13_9PLEO|nr:hypothetical protein EJ02DRAFT_438351 [Clathrospora elynae]
MSKPSNTIEKPSNTIEKPPNTIEKPSSTMAKPTDTTLSPSNSMDNPTISPNPLTRPWHSVSSIFKPLPTAAAPQRSLSLQKRLALYILPQPSAQLVMDCTSYDTN